jgi:isopentenyl diphosphate isomerase/L-lactate dehydrogenase-like FMN-dependent dehydrogenase
MRLHTPRKEYTDVVVAASPSSVPAGATHCPTASCRTPAIFAELLNTLDFERAAAPLLSADVLAYLATGAEDETTLQDNRAAFDRWSLRPRVLVDVTRVSTATTILGKPISSPVLVAPTAGHAQFHPAGEGATALGAAQAGTIMCVSISASMSAPEIAAVAPEGRRWLQACLYQRPGFADRMVEYAVASGFEAIVLTVDTPYVGLRERARRVPRSPRREGLLADIVGTDAKSKLDASVTWRDVAGLVERSPLPVLVKGILTAEDAALACEHDVAGIIVSNHGARQLDGAVATLDALPEVVDAVAERTEVLMDGGVRRGTEVVKALALGARAVLVGRPAVHGLIVGGAAGVHRVLEILEEETRLALALLGSDAPSAVSRAHLSQHPGAAAIGEHRCG